MNKQFGIELNFIIIKIVSKIKVRNLSKRTKTLREEQDLIDPNLLTEIDQNLKIVNQRKIT